MGAIIYITYALWFYFILDIIVLIINLISNVGYPGTCATDGWKSGILVFSSLLKPSECPDTNENTGIRGPGKWRNYAVQGPDDADGNATECLYEQQIDTLVQDIKDDYVVQGYTSIQLLSYVIIPTITALSISYWLISTRANKAEWTFWIMIITLIYTGLSSVVQQTAGIDVTPPSVSCLTHVSDTLGLDDGDELRYSFMARRQQGDQCFMEGTFLSTAEGGIADPSQPQTYTGEIPNCSAEKMPMY